MAEELRSAPDAAVVPALAGGLRQAIAALGSADRRYGCHNDRYRAFLLHGEGGR